ncbi:MAG TPA: carboxypeptidase regulatory-like domain-containing protein [Myxococcales bacterium]|jgi:hypothetical protein
MKTAAIRINPLFVLAIAALAGTACKSRSSSSQRETGNAAAPSGKLTATTAVPGTLSVTMAPAALAGGAFAVDVALRNSAGSLLDVSDVVTLSLATSPVPGATLNGTLSKAAVHGVASFTDLGLSSAGSGYVLAISSSQATVAAPAVQSQPFKVAYSEDDQLSTGAAANSSAAAAQTVSPNVPIFGTLGGGEIHYYKFAAKAGQVLDVASYGNRLDLANWDTSLRIRLLNTDGATEMARAGAIGPNTNFVDAGLRAVIPSTGTYYLACDQDQAGFASGKFGVLLAFAAVPNGGTFQTEAEAPGTTGANDTAATAEALLPGTMYGRYDNTAAGATAPDFYKIAISGPTRVHLELSAARAGAAGGGNVWDGTLMLQDSAGNVLWQSDNALFLDPAIDYVFTTAATYYVRVSRADYAANRGGSPYLLSYSASAYAPAKPAPGATTAGAATVAYGADVSASFSAAGAQYFSFSGTAGDVVRLTLLDKSALQGATLAADANTFPTTMTASGPTSGSIASPGGGAVALPGTVIVSPQAPATPVLLARNASAATPSTSATGVDATLLGSDGTTALAAAVGIGTATDNEPNTRQTILQTTGKFFVRFTSPVAGSFGFRIDNLSSSTREAEPNDTAATATAIGANGWASGVISSPTDKDHFKIHAEAGQLVTVGILGAAGGGIGTMAGDFGSALVPVVEVRDSAAKLLVQTAADRKGLTNYAESMAHPELTMETSFRAPAAGDYDLAVYDADGQGGDKAFYALHVWKNPDGQVSTGSVSGIVTNVQTGSAVSGATVSWSGGSTTSDASGNYTLGGIPAGAVTVTGDSTGYLARSYGITVTAGATASQAVQLSTSGKLVGNVTGDGTALASAKVQITGGQIATTASDITDTTGHYDEGWVAIGTYTVTCSATGFPSQTISGAAVTTGNTTTVNCALSSTGTVSGKVTNVQTGSAISGATVSWSGGSATSDATGSFTLAKVTAGAVALTGTATGYLDRSSSVTVAGGGTTTSNLQLSTSGKLVGNATHTGAALTGVTVTATGGQIATTATDTTDSVGHYDEQWLPIGTYKVTCSKSGFTSVTVSGVVATGATTTVNCAL